MMANFRAAEVTWTGKARSLRRSSPLALRGFCVECGSPLSFQYDDSDHVSIPVGALDAPEALRPLQHGGIESRLPWIAIDPHLPEERCDEDPDYRSLVERTGWRPPS